MYRYAHAEIYIIYQAVYILVAHREPARMQAYTHTPMHVYAQTHTRARVRTHAHTHVERYEIQLYESMVYTVARSCVYVRSYVCI